MPVDHDVGPEVAAGDVEADPRVTAHVAGLGAVVGRGDPDDLLLRIPGVVHVGELRPPLLPEGDQHSLPLPGNQLGKPPLDHAALEQRPAARCSAGGPGPGRDAAVRDPPGLLSAARRKASRIAITGKAFHYAAALTALFS